MKSSTRLLIIAAILAFIAAAVFLVQSKVFVLTDVVMEEPSAESKVEPDPDAPNFTPLPAPTPEEMKTAAVVTPEFADPNGGPPIMPSLPLQKGEPLWEAQLRTVLTAPALSDAEQARRLFSLIPGMAVEGRETAAENAVKLVTNADYDVARPVLLNPGMYGPALNVLFADLAERPPEIALPTLLQLARISQHPFAPNALEDLQLMLHADYGTDWNRWDAAIRAALAAKK